MTVERLIQELETLPKDLIIATCGEDSNECFDELEIDVVNDIAVLYEVGTPKKLQDMTRQTTI